MSDKQQEAFHNIVELMGKETSLLVQYWREYSNMGTWQFWFHAAMLVVPLIVLYYALDRTRAFHIGFFGLAIHMAAAYLDVFATTHGYWNYPYKLTPHLSASFSLDASLIPVTFMLLYQWTLNRNKNYYFYSLLLCAAFSFVFKPFLSAINQFAFFKGANYGHLFVAYVTAAMLGKWVTDIFVGFHRRADRLYKV